MQTNLPDPALQQQALMPPDLGQLLQNVAVVPDGIELAFAGDKCGRSYKIKHTSIDTWDSFFYDWHEGGWVELRGYGGWHDRKQAIETCNKHAIENRLIKFLPHRPKFKPNPNLCGLSGIASAASTAAAVAGLGL